MSVPSKLAQEVNPQINQTNTDAAYWKQRYEETLVALQQEQIAHAKTKDNLLKILGDAIAVKSFNS